MYEKVVCEKTVCNFLCATKVGHLTTLCRERVCDKNLCQSGVRKNCVLQGGV